MSRSRRLCSTSTVALSACRMTLPPILPDWIPPWAQLALLVAALVFALALLMMPFAVFGLKGRLDLLEAQLDDIHSDLRLLAMRLAESEPERSGRRVAAEPDDRIYAQRAPAQRVEERAEPRLRRPPGADRLP